MGVDLDRPDPFRSAEEIVWFERSSSFLKTFPGAPSPLFSNIENHQIMDDMDIDDMVIPDTPPPERLAARHGVCRDSVGRVCNSPLANKLINSDFADEKSGNGSGVKERFIYENDHSKRVVIRPPRSSSLAIDNGSSGANSYASQNAHLYRTPAVGRNSSCETKHSSGTENFDRGKSLSIKTLSKSAFPENTEVLDLPEHNSHSQLHRKVFPYGKLEDVAQGTRNQQIMSVGSSADCSTNYSERSRNASKAKEKIDGSTFDGVGLASPMGKRVDLPTELQHKAEHQKPMTLHSFTLPRVSGQKRLVRNGCISPHNIATRSKQLGIENTTSSKHNEHSNDVDAVSSGSPYVIDASDVATEDKKRERAKGKGVMVQPSIPKENNSRVVDTSTSLLNDDIEANRTRHVGRDGCSEGIGGWRSTRNRLRTMDPLISDSTEYLPRTYLGAGNFVNQHGSRVKREDTWKEGNYINFSNDLSLNQTASTVVSEPGQMAGQRREGKRAIRREKKRGSSMGHHGEGSTLDIGDSDIMFLGSSETSESLNSSRIRRPQSQGMLRPVIEVDELSPVTGLSDPQGLNSMNDDLEAKARQLEADEMLARELQEQLYHETPAFGGSEIDEHLAWALQREENVLNTSSSGRHNIPHSRGFTTLNSHRQPQSQSSQNPSARRGAQARVPSSSTMTQLRNRLRNQSTRGPNRRRNVRVPFPSDMDLDMRLNILEALETAVGDVRDVALNNHMFQLQRDFNANDYEMLLALDENNHQLGGATSNQINNLPQSTVQTDAFEEACAICLETPALGETVRHLPCLHRFHKDCIDPWLNRKTSCPVCKCSIS
ncbi:uncharacterized protein LOC126789949 isoform X2 [Argentina anserina]|uniref:uncharacterized protein LOC126789949 isoform X2 n=1 Tax=Argentina anserina TaxID=57926 RepID=UPI0021768EC8|nr:uncharacterized protein LOC126789949 isoform X2 [Potentilla anserina]